MTLVRFKELSLQFSDHPLLACVDFAIEEGERVCLIGRNGAGKSSLLKLITGEYHPDDGEIEYRQNLRIAKLRQELEGESALTARELVTRGLAGQQALIDQYDSLSQESLSTRGLHDLEVLQQRIDAGGGWTISQQVARIMSRLSLPAERRMSELSGGWRRRVSLGRALVSRPDLLLLDEPTNHLDLTTIEWLENEVRGFAGGVLFITHDRAFMQRVATRIVEIDRGRLVSWPGDYHRYLVGKEAMIEQEDRDNALFDKRLAGEETWIRQGIKARRTRNEGRVRSLVAMREKRAARVARSGRARIRISESDQSGRKVITARSISYSYGAQKIIDGLSLKVMRGDRIGVIGNNGVGKSTLLRLLLGELEPDTGTVKLGTNLAIAYFDQLRRELDLDKTVAESVGGGREYININGKDRHVVGYMTDFLFSAKRAMTPVRALSGGERNRVILAQLFAQRSNLLVLDEPTNDLDVEMLEVLEARLAEYEGTLIVVSHDREFLDAVVTSTLVFEGGDRLIEYVGGYSDWARRGHVLTTADDPTPGGRNDACGSRANSSNAVRSGKIPYHEKRELELLSGEIESLERRVEALQAEVSAPAFYAQQRDHVQARLAAFTDVQRSLDARIERWGELEEKQQAFDSRDG